MSAERDGSNSSSSGPRPELDGFHRRHDQATPLVIVTVTEQAALCVVDCCASLLAVDMEPAALLCSASGATGSPGGGGGSRWPILCVAFAPRQPSSMWRARSRPPPRAGRYGGGRATGDEWECAGGVVGQCDGQQPQANRSVGRSQRFLFLCLFCSHFVAKDNSPHRQAKHEKRQQQHSSIEPTSDLSASD